MENATITICGNYGKDPELRYGAASGKPFLNMPVAVTSGTKEKPKTSWFDVKFFEEQACQMAELPKGTRVIVTGNLRQDTYDDADGNTQYRTVVYAQEAGLSLRWS
tara:strand:+ start:234 stop:551 length:318 start_codon:yes stop_codon:yes gene_type:complete